jgi:putative transcriptional regulator
MPETGGNFNPDFDPEIHKRRLGTGSLLVACDRLSDPNFDSAIVLLCQYGTKNTFGLVLNRPSHMPINELFEHPPANILAVSKNRRIYVGGPVQPAEVQVLQVGLEPAPASLEVASGVYFGGVWNDLEEILSRDTRNIRLFLGYSGWAEGQLESEVEAGAWEVYNTDVLRLLLSPEEAWFGGSDVFKRFLDFL